MGFKKTSDTIAISFGVTETAAGTMAQDEISLQLDVLNNEIFVVLGIDLDVSNPEAIAATDTASRSSLTSTPSPFVSNLSQTNCLATAREAIRARGFVDSGVGFTRTAETTIPAMVDYLGLISTNNFFVQVQGSNNVDPTSVVGRLWGYRARADASTYAALVQSEVLSAWGFWMVSIRSALRGLYSAAAIAGATAGGGPPAGAAMAAFLKSAPGRFAMDRAIDNTLQDQDLDSGNFASGGLVMSPTLALIGEAGPEMVLPLTPIKKKRKTTKYQKELGKQLARQNKLHRLKNGSLRKGKTAASLLKAAHKLTRLKLR